MHAGVYLGDVHLRSVAGGVAGVVAGVSRLGNCEKFLESLVLLSQVRFQQRLQVVVQLLQVEWRSAPIL